MKRYGLFVRQKYSKGSDADEGEPPSAWKQVEGRVLAKSRRAAVAELTKMVSLRLRPVRELVEDPVSKNLVLVTDNGWYGRWKVRQVA